jgi:PadR family transcriptional regulator PadR
MIFQVGAALLDACVLSALRHEDAYGYVLTQTLRDSLEISESTLYPVLRRLQKDDCLSTYDRPWQGRNRRYYSITEKGRAQAEIYRGGWQEYKTRVDSLIFSEPPMGDSESMGGVAIGMGAGEATGTAGGKTVSETVGAMNGRRQEQ